MTLLTIEILRNFRCIAIRYSYAGIFIYFSSAVNYQPGILSTSFIECFSLLSLNNDLLLIFELLQAFAVYVLAQEINCKIFAFQKNLLN